MGSDDESPGFRFIDFSKGRKKEGKRERGKSILNSTSPRVIIPFCLLDFLEFSKGYPMKFFKIKQ